MPTFTQTFTGAVTDQYTPTGGFFDQIVTWVPPAGQTFAFSEDFWAGNEEVFLTVLRWIGFDGMRIDTRNSGNLRRELASGWVINGSMTLTNSVAGSVTLRTDASGFSSSNYKWSLAALTAAGFDPWWTSYIADDNPRDLSITLAYDPPPKVGEPRELISRFSLGRVRTFASTDEAIQLLGLSRPIAPRLHVGHPAKTSQYLNLGVARRVAAGGTLWRFDPLDIPIADPRVGTGTITGIRLRSDQIRIIDGNNLQPDFSEIAQDRGTIIFYSPAAGEIEVPIGHLSSDGRIDTAAFGQEWVDWWADFSAQQSNPLEVWLVIHDLITQLSVGRPVGQKGNASVEIGKQLLLGRPDARSTVIGVPNEIELEHSLSEPLPFAGVSEVFFRHSLGRPVVFDVGRPGAVTVEHSLSRVHAFSHAEFVQQELSLSKINPVIFASVTIERGSSEIIPIGLPSFSFSTGSVWAAGGGYSGDRFAITQVSAVNTGGGVISILFGDVPDGFIASGSLVLLSDTGRITLDLMDSGSLGNFRVWSVEDGTMPTGGAEWIAALLAQDQSDRNLVAEFATAGGRQEVRHFAGQPRALVRSVSARAIALSLSVGRPVSFAHGLAISEQLAVGRPLGSIRRTGLPLAISQQLAVSRPRHYLRSVAGTDVPLELRIARPRRIATGRPGALTQQLAVGMPEGEKRRTARPRTINVSLSLSSPASYLRSVGGMPISQELTTSRPKHLRIGIPAPITLSMVVGDPTAYAHGVAISQELSTGRPTHYLRSVAARPIAQSLALNRPHSFAHAEFVDLRMGLGRPRGFFPKVAARPITLSMTAGDPTAYAHGTAISQELEAGRPVGFVRSSGVRPLFLDLVTGRPARQLLVGFMPIRMNLQASRPVGRIPKVAARPITLSIATGLTLGSIRRTGTPLAISEQLAVGRPLHYLRSVGAAGISQELTPGRPFGERRRIARGTPLILDMALGQARGFFPSIAGRRISASLSLSDPFGFIEARGAGVGLALSQSMPRLRLFGATTGAHADLSLSEPLHYLRSVGASPLSQSMGLGRVGGLAVERADVEAVRLLAEVSHPRVSTVVFDRVGPALGRRGYRRPRTLARRNTASRYRLSEVEHIKWGEGYRADDGRWIRGEVERRAIECTVVPGGMGDAFVRTLLGQDVQRIHDVRVFYVYGSNFAVESNSDVLVWDGDRYRVRGIRVYDERKVVYGMREDPQ